MILEPLFQPCAFGPLHLQSHFVMSSMQDRRPSDLLPTKELADYYRDRIKGGIGLINKLKAYELQDMGLNTIEANIHLGQAIDARHYDIAVEMLRELGVKQIHLLTNNPDKVQAFEESDVKVLSRIPLIIEPGDANIDYLRTKQREMGHMLNVK